MQSYAIPAQDATLHMLLVAALIIDLARKYRYDAGS